MADERKISSQHEQAPPAATGKPEAPITPSAEKPEQITLDSSATPAGTDTLKTNTPSKAAPTVEPKDAPKPKDGKVIDITGKTAPTKKPAAPAKTVKSEKTGKAKPANKSPSC